MYFQVGRFQHNSLLHCRIHNVSERWVHNCVTQGKDVG